MANIVKNIAFMEFPLQISRQYAGPVDRFEVWYDYASLVEYAANNAVSYAGQKVVLVNEEEGSLTFYGIRPDGTLQEVGGVLAGDGKSITIKDGVIQLFGFGEPYGEDSAPFEAGLQLVTVDDGDGGFKCVWVKPDTSTVEGLVTAVEALDGRVTVLEGSVVKNVEIAGVALSVDANKATMTKEQLAQALGLGSAAYTESTAYEPANAVANHNTAGDAHNDIRTELQSIKEMAEGRTTTYVYQDKEDPEYIAAVAVAGSFKLGDNIYFIATDVADQWVSAVNAESPFYTFTNLDVDHPDLSGYVQAVADLTQDKILLGNASKQAKASIYGIVGTLTDTDANNIPHSKAVADYVTSKLNAYITIASADTKYALKTDLAALTTRVTNLESSVKKESWESLTADSSQFKFISASAGYIPFAVYRTSDNSAVVVEMKTTASGYEIISDVDFAGYALSKKA